MAFSTRAMRPEDWKALRHFAPHEFRHPERMGYEFMLWLDTLRSLLKFGLHPSSDYRSPEANAAADGSFTSAHMDPICDAVDLSARTFSGYTRLRTVIVAYELGCRRFGVYSNGSLHLDRTEDRRPEAMWVKSK